MRACVRVRARLRACVYVCMLVCACTLSFEGCRHWLLLFPARKCSQLEGAHFNHHCHQWDIFISSDSDREMSVPGTCQRCICPITCQACSPGSLKISFSLLKPGRKDLKPCFVVGIFVIKGEDTSELDFPVDWWPVVMVSLCTSTIVAITLCRYYSCSNWNPEYAPLILWYDVLNGFQMIQTLYY